MTGDRTNAQAGSRSRKGDRAGNDPPQAKSRRKPPRPIVTAKPPTFRRVCNGLTRPPIKYGKQRGKPLADRLAAALWLYRASERKEPAPAFPGWRTAAPPGPAAHAGRERALKRAMRIMRQAWRELTRMDATAADKAAPEPRGARPPKPEPRRYEALKGG